MPIRNATYIPPNSNIRTVMTSIGTALTPIMETVRYALRLPDEEDPNLDLVAYIEFEPQLVVSNESIESNQRHWAFRIVVYVLMNSGNDSLLFADLIELVTKTLYTAANITIFRNAFSTDNGFSIEQITVAETGFGEQYEQVKFALDCSFHHYN